MKLDLKQHMETEMPQAVTGHKIKNAFFVMGLPAVFLLGACETIKDADIAENASGKSRYFEGKSLAIAEPSKVENDEGIPEAPPVTTEVFQSDYYTLWQETQDSGEPETVTIDPEEIEADAGFFGDTYSVIEPAAPARPVKPTQTSTTPEQTVPTPVPAVSGGQFGLHLASYRSEKNAKMGWQILEEQYASVLSTVAPRLNNVDVPEQGRFYRLIAGPYTSRGAAAEACALINIAGDYCVVTDFAGDAFGG